jgi:hypothetical protein
MESRWSFPFCLAHLFPHLLLVTEFSFPFRAIAGGEKEEREKKREARESYTS